jgi:imidazoleglycerol-phosphate dehydratase / histidinol-phosphatase
MKTLARPTPAYSGSPSTRDLSSATGLDPIDIIRFDSNVPAAPPPYARAATIAQSLAEVNEYTHGGHPELKRAIAKRHDVSAENVVLGAGSGDLILLCARALLRPGDVASIVPARTFPLYRIGVLQAGAVVGEESPALTFVCRPNNPSGELTDLPAARPLIVDEAYAEYAGVSSAGLIDDGVIVLRTFSKAFGLAAARVGYALADKEIAAELNRWQAPHPISTMSAVLAEAALRNPPDVAAQVEERDRLAAELRSIGLAPLPSFTNFVFVPLEDVAPVADALLQQGIVVRRYDDGIRINVRDRHDDDLLLRALASVLEVPWAGKATAGRTVRHLRATAETSIRIRLALDGNGVVRVSTGAGLYDHLLEQLAFHAGTDLLLEAIGDLETGAHHTAEDAARALGDALNRVLGDRRGLARYGDAVVPMDEALARVAVDLSGRPSSVITIDPDPGLAAHVLDSFAQNARITLHVDARGADAHHVAEAAFKAVGRALRGALREQGDGVNSTKGVL